MIETNLTGAESELREVINLFPESESAHIKHVFKDGADRLINAVTVDGGAYVYGNLIPAGLTPLIKKRLIKRYAKLSVYKALSKKYGKDLPWGALTGIRPTALAYSEMDKDGRFEEFFTEIMKVSPEKTALTRAVIEAQRGVYEKNPDNTDFFVFIPFCPSRCRYCSFVTADMARYAPLANDYAETLAREIEASAPLVKKLRSIYIGGGTPVALSDGQLEKVLTALDKINAGVEYTAEAGRPDRITKENLSILKAHGVTRVCVNPQTFSDETLKRIGRNHTAAEAEEKFLLAKSMGFSVNMDFIAGLEGEKEEDFFRTIERAITLAPDDITVHTLCIKRGSYLAESEKRLLGGEHTQNMVNYAYKALTAAGYRPYYLYRQKYMSGNLENVGYAKPGKECVYNIDTMEEISSTVACGAGAISKRVDFTAGRIERQASPKDVKTYLDKEEEIMRRKLALFS